MAKRKRSGRPAQEPDGPNMDVGASRMRIRDYEDVAGSDDDFHIQRDKVLLGEEPEAKKRRKVAEQEEFLEQSDEEVLDYSESEDEDGESGDEDVDAAQGYGGGEDVDSEEEGERANRDDDEDEVGWGTSKADLYGADAIETEEQALEEEAEALRLQKKQLQSMSAADYGFDEADWQAGGKEVEDPDEVVTEVLPQLHVTESMGPAERLKLLKQRYPEFEPLSKELLALQEEHASLVEQAKAAASTTEDHTANAVTKLRAASAYLGALTMYFSLLTSTATREGAGVNAFSAAKLRDHPVMDSLVQCRELWQKVRTLPADRSVPAAASTLSSSALDVLDEEQPAMMPKTVRKPKKSRAERHAEAAHVAAEVRKTERMEKTEAGLADLDALIAPSASRRTAKAIPKGTARDDASDLGEEAPLTARQAADKAQRKKSLRFYTSQIAQKANKRGASGRNAGGDEDVPHRERLRDRQARLNAEAEKRGKRHFDAPDELGGDSDDEDRQQAKAIRAEAEGGDYYDLIASRTAKKKSDKSAFAEAQRQAALSGGRVVEAETVGADGKRGISYAIEKNKGLTPHRKKDVRNPRVKKRKKYEEKNKKLASMKPTYKGGEGRGGYGGELTGIKKGLVKSTKL